MSKACLTRHGTRAQDTQYDDSVACVAPANVGRYTLECHDCHRARFLRDARLLNVGHVHDHAALEHLRKTSLDGKSALLLIRHSALVRGVYVRSAGNGRFGGDSCRR